MPKADHRAMEKGVRNIFLDMGFKLIEKRKQYVNPDFIFEKDGRTLVVEVSTSGKGVSDIESGLEKYFDIGPVLLVCSIEDIKDKIVGRFINGEDLTAVTYDELMDEYNQMKGKVVLTHSTKYTREMMKFGWLTPIGPSGLEL